MAWIKSWISTGVKVTNFFSGPDHTNTHVPIQYDHKRGPVEWIMSWISRGAEVTNFFSTHARCFVLAYGGGVCLLGFWFLCVCSRVFVQCRLTVPQTLIALVCVGCYGARIFPGIFIPDCGDRRYSSSTCVQLKAGMSSEGVIFLMDY